MIIEKKKVLFISHSGDLYGAQRCLLDLILNIDAKIIPIVILPQKGQFYDLLCAKSIEVYLIPFRGWWFRKYRIKMFYRLSFNLFAAFRIIRLIRKSNIKLIYTNTVYSPIGLLVSHFLSIPHLSHLHEFLNLNESAKFDFGVKASMNFLNANSKIIIATSNAHKRDLQRYLSENKIQVVYNGFYRKGNIRIINNLDENRVLKIIMVGSISRNKGQLIALKALNILVKEGFKVQLSFIGDTLELDYQNLLMDFIMKEGLTNYVIFKGYQKVLDKYYIKNDLLLVCSRYETFGRVIIEAMSFKCPVISTKLPAVQEIIIDGYNGILFDYNDYQYLAKCIEKVFNNLTLKNHLSQNGYNTYKKNFTLTSYVESINLIINNILNNE